jgi:hypothetical protein
LGPPYSEPTCYQLSHAAPTEPCRTSGGQKLTKFQLASKIGVIRWLKQGFTLVPEHSGFFSADLKSFLSHLINVFPITLSSI